MTKSVLRYSDADLNEFNKIIQAKLETARKELTYIKESLSRRNESGTENTASEYHSIDDGAGSAEKENLSNMAGRLQKFIQQLEFANIRIKNGTYGVCVDTGNLIPKDRLRAVPHTQHSIEAKMKKA